MTADEEDQFIICQASEELDENGCLKNKRVRVRDRAEIKEIELTDASFVLPIRQDKNIIFYGDSITQGYDALHPSKTYAYRLSEALKANMLNKALGGDHFCPDLVKAANAYNPEYVIVAYGTNDWNYCTENEFIHNCKQFLYSLNINYPNSKIFVITPIWRKEMNESRRFGDFKNIEKIIKNQAEEFDNISVISGFEFVPQNENLFADMRLHPNDKGFEYYFENLSKHIKEILHN
jgi:lysophospholipase L1-like esterase